MRPVDQFEAYYAMTEEGKPVADIAARFGKTVNFVRGRLALARVSAVLLDLYRNEEMTFEQLSAFTLTDDHERQVTVWENLPYWNASADSIRRALRSDSITANDKRLRFIGGIEAYEAVGGAVKRDLFDDQHSGYATDIALIEKLVADRLEAEAAILRAEGWNWIEIVDALPFANRMDRVYAQPVPLTDEQQSQLDTLEVQLAEVMERFEREEATAEDIEAENALTQEIEALRNQGEAYDQSDIERSGCYVTIDYYGKLCVERGLIRPDETEDALDQDGIDQPQNEHKTERAEEAAQPAFKMPAAFEQELSAQKTAAIRAELAYNPTVALATVVHALLLSLYSYGGREQTALEITLSNVGPESSIKDAAEVKAIQTMNIIAAEMKSKLPENPADLWSYCMACNQQELLNLLAFAASQSLNAIQLPHSSRLRQRNHADRIAEALQMNMEDWFVPTAANYFSRISKAGIEAALTEVKGADFAEGVSGMKKADAAAYAERQTRGTGWLPKEVRLTSDTGLDIAEDADEDHDANDDYNGDLDTDYPLAAE